MASYRRSRRYYRRRLRGRYYRRRYYRRSYARRYVNGSSRSAIRVKCVVTNSFSKTSGYDSTLGSVFSLQPFAGTTEGLQASPLYRNYCNLYEEVKLIGMKVAVNIITPVGGAALPSLQIYSMFDRRHGESEPFPTADEIKNASSMSVATALNNSVAKISRSCYASDLIEKAQWIDSSLDDSFGYRNVAWHTAGLNPNFFCPSFHMCFGSPSLTSGTEATVAFTVSTVFYVAFRNPKFGGTGSAKDVPSRVSPYADEPGDMDDYGPDAAGSDGDVDVSIPSTRTLTHSSVVADRSDPILSSRPSRKTRKGL